jgi:L-alanine-DL-glutamate epimerase-like enolase superfamily enzyme
LWVLLCRAPDQRPALFCFVAAFDRISISAQSQFSIVKITDVQSFLLSYPLPEPLRLVYHGGERTILKRDAMLILLRTDEGITGYGPGQGSERAKRMIDQVIRPFLVGRSLSDPDGLRLEFQQNAGADADVSKVYGSVEIALYDLLGKQRGLPVSELVGRRVRQQIRLYGSAGMYMSPPDYAQEALAIKQMGFTAYKMRPGRGPAEDLEAVRAMRRAVGPDFELMIDAHTWWRMGDRNYTQQQVYELAEKMAESRIAWLEEPFPPDDHEAFFKLKQAGLVPLATGEHEPSELRFMDLIQSASVDYIQMDLICQGGYSTARRLFADIARAGLTFAFHSWGTALEVVAAAQIGACWPESVVRWLEYPCYSAPGRTGMYPFPLADEILKQPLQIDRGDLLIPSGPGLGVEVDESIIWRYPWIPGPWSFFRLESPPETWSVTADHSVKWDDGK